MAYKQRITDTKRFYRAQYWNTQPTPWKTPLPFTSKSSKMKAGVTYDGNNARDGLAAGSFESIPLWRREALKTRAYEKFRDELAEFSMVAVNYAERGRAVDALVNRSTGAAASLVLLKQKRWQALLRAAKKVGANWNKVFLEFHFGWIPLARDIFNTVEAILKPPTGKYISKGASDYFSFDAVSGGNFHTKRDLSIGVRIKGNVLISNPNLFLFNQLGLLNPASIAWELVPFSFVLDWFSNINTVLSQFTDFAGVDTSKVSWTSRVQGTITEWYGPPYNWFGPTYETFELVRQPGLPAILPTLKPFKGFSVVRGITAIALLLNAGSPFRTLFNERYS